MLTARARTCGMLSHGFRSCAGSPALVLWVVVAAVWLFPHLDLPLRAIAPFGLAAAICRTVVAPCSHIAACVPRALAGISLVRRGRAADRTARHHGRSVQSVHRDVRRLHLAGGSHAVAAVGDSPSSAVSIAGFGWLVIDHVQAELAEHHRLNDFPTHLFTMWMAGAAIAELVAHYVARARAALAQRQQLLDEARERALRSEHLASLTTLAAGAAHELSTPLATIAVAARELERNGWRRHACTRWQAFCDDARLIRTEVDRCQVILDGMSGRAPDGAPAAAEPLRPRAIAQLVRDRLTRRAAAAAPAWKLRPISPAPSVAGAAMVQAISSLLKNAFDASDATLGCLAAIRPPRTHGAHRGAGPRRRNVRRRCAPCRRAVLHNEGAGRRGWASGSFSTRTFAERAGGTLQFDTSDGTTAILEIPGSPVEAHAH